MVGVEFDDVDALCYRDRGGLAVLLDHPGDFVTVHCVRNLEVGITTGLLRGRQWLAALQHHLHGAVAAGFMDRVHHPLHTIGVQRIAEMTGAVCADSRRFEAERQRVLHEHGSTADPFVATLHARHVVLHELLELFLVAHEVAGPSRVRRHHQPVGQLHLTQRDGLEQRQILRHGPLRASTTKKR